MTEHQRTSLPKKATRTSKRSIKPDESRSEVDTATALNSGERLAQNPEAVLQLQRTIGNTATRQRVPQTSLQRDPAPAPAKAATWKPPYEFDDITTTATTKGEAAMGVLLMVDRMSRVKNKLEQGGNIDELTSCIKSGSKVIEGIHATLDSEAPLTTDDLNQLMIFNSFSGPAYSAAVYTVRARLMLAFEPAQKELDTSQLDAVEEKLAEKLHDAFNNGLSDTAVSQLRDGVKTVSDYKEKADKYVTWAKRAADMLKYSAASELLEDIGKHSKTLGEGLGKVKQVVDAADAMQTLFGGQRTSDAADGIARFRSALTLIDIGMGFAKAVPLLGQLWSSYYSPMTKAILNNMEVVFNLIDQNRRQLALFEFIQQPRKAGVPPIVPDYLMQYFPGGQPVLNFMYAVMNGGDQKVTPQVEKYFVENVSRFNAGIKEDHDKLDTESTAGWNPTSWFGSERKAPDLLGWVLKNKTVVWSQLYGSLPPTLN